MKLSSLIKNCNPIKASIIDAEFEINRADAEFETNRVDAEFKDTDFKISDSEIEITSIHSNAGEVKKGGLFIAVKGFKADGHDYIEQAVKNGASAVVVDKKDFSLKTQNNLAIENSLETENNSRICKIESQVIIIEVQDTRKAMSSISAAFYGYPSNSMTLVGITGTNGKTTTSFLIESILKSAGYKTGVIGTIHYRYDGKVFENPVTTPESIDIHRILSQMKNAGVTHVVMEVSSHAVDLHRVRDCEFDVGVFTNLTQDHLDYHKTMDSYFECKKSFFTKQLTRGSKRDKSTAVINIDYSYGKELVKSGLETSVITTGVNIPNIVDSNIGNSVFNSIDSINSKIKNIWSSNIEDNITGLTGTLNIKSINSTPNGKSNNESSEGKSDNKSSNSIVFKSQLTGRFNLENILSAAGAAEALNISPEIIVKGIESCDGVPGRLERVENSRNRYVFVDYAHTPDALKSILETLKQRAPSRLISVFGCGGDRDKTKRPIMGEIAYNYSDVVVITSDNPRTENPDSIINDILEGIKFSEIAERRETISGTEEIFLNSDSSSNIDKLLSTKNCNTKSRNIRKYKQIIVEPDRAEALKIAVSISEPYDIIAAAGKGHETYQITAQGKIDFDDRIVLKEALNNFESMPIPWSFYDILNALNIDYKTQPLISDLYFKIFTSISTDSRNITKDDLFAALKGEQFDGHDFISDLINQGIKGFIVEKSFYDNLGVDKKEEIDRALSNNEIALFQVDNTLKALGMLANFQRVRSGVKVAAITGSNGKTTTRKMTSSIFENYFKTLSTYGNLNNEIGVPLTLLKLSKEHEWAVIEMGMNHKGEIERLSKIASPDIAVITNTTDAHLEGVGTVNDVAGAKAEITYGMNRGSTLIINRDDPRWEIIFNKSKEFPNIENIILFGSDKEKSGISAENILFSKDGIEFTLCINSKKSCWADDFKCKSDSSQSNIYYKNCKIKTPAHFMLNNALAASAAGLAASIPENIIKQGLLMFEPASGRMKIIKLGKIESNAEVYLIDDTYNANPGSVKAAIETLSYLSKENESIAVLGDMLELGEQSPDLHFQIGQKVAQCGISRLYTHGNMALQIASGAEKNGLSKDRITEGTKEEISESLINYIRDKEIEKRSIETEIEKRNIGREDKRKNEIWILIKGSRGMRMETIVKSIIETDLIT